MLEEGLFLDFLRKKVTAISATTTPILLTSTIRYDVIPTIHVRVCVSAFFRHVSGSIYFRVRTGVALWLLHTMLVLELTRGKFIDQWCRKGDNRQEVGGNATIIS